MKHTQLVIATETADTEGPRIIDWLKAFRRAGLAIYADCDQEATLINVRNHSDHAKPGRDLLNAGFNIRSEAEIPAAPSSFDQFVQPEEHLEAVEIIAPDGKKWADLDPVEKRAASTAILAGRRLGKGIGELITDQEPATLGVLMGRLLKQKSNSPHGSLPFQRVFPPLAAVHMYLAYEIVLAAHPDHAQAIERIMSEVYAALVVEFGAKGAMDTLKAAREALA